MVPRRCTIKRGGYPSTLRPPPNFFCWGSTLLYNNIDSGLLQPALPRVGMERFLPSAGGSSAAGLKPCGEPTCQSKSQLVSGSQSLGVLPFSCGVKFWYFCFVFLPRVDFWEERCPLFGVFARFFCMLWSALPTVS